MLNDADLELAVKAAVAGRYQNTGQVCAAAKRFIIEEGIASAFTERFVAAAAALKMGDPRDEENALGPMARFDLRDELHHQVEKTPAQGARLLLGGEKMAGAGNYYPPTVLANVTPEMTAFREEMFGPVAAITIAKDAEHALELANDSEFGLSATIFTTDETQARQMAARLECGGVFINGYCASDARVAFGGVKRVALVVSFPISAYTNSVISRRCGKTGSDATYSALIYSQVFSDLRSRVESGSRHG